MVTSIFCLLLHPAFYTGHLRSPVVIIINIFHGGIRYYLAAVIITNILLIRLAITWCHNHIFHMELEITWCHKRSPGTITTRDKLT